MQGQARGGRLKKRSLESGSSGLKSRQITGGSAMLGLNEEVAGQFHRRYFIINFLDMLWWSPFRSDGLIQSFAPRFLSFSPTARNLQKIHRVASRPIYFLNNNKYLSPTCRWNRPGGALTLMAESRVRMKLENFLRGTFRTNYSQTLSTWEFVTR